MYFRMPCPHCQMNLKINDEHVGRKAQCPYCRATFVVQKPQGDDSPRSDVDPGKTVVAPSSAPPYSVSDTSTHPEGAPAPQAPPQAPPQAMTPQAMAQSMQQTIPSSMMQTAPGMAPYQQRPSALRRTPLSKADGTNVSLIWTGLIGLGIAAVFYTVLVLPLHSTFVGSLFAHRGWVPYVIVLLTAWSGTMIVWKMRKLSRQKRSLLFDLLPNELAPAITPDNVEIFSSHLASLPGDPNHSFLISRVSRALNHFKARGNVQEVGSLLSSQAEIDATAVDSSYAMLKVFIWAIPILGFIGTVLGIGSAVGGFSESMQGAQELDAIKNSLGGVTSGLAVAFDTTLLALIMSIFIMFPARSMQKAEEDLLNSLEEYCNEELLRRLDDESGAKTAEDPNLIKRAVSEAMGEHLEQLSQWSSQLDSIGGSLTDRVVQGWEGIHAKMENDHARRIEEVRSVLADATQDKSEFITQAKQLQDGQVEQLTQAVNTMSETADRVNEQLSTLHQAQLHSAEQTLAAVNDQVDRSTTTLSEHVGEMADKTAQILQQQLTALQQFEAAAKTGAEGFAGHLSEITEAAQRNTQAASEQIMAKHDESLQRVAAMTETLAQTQQSIEQAGAQHLAQLAAEGEKLLASIAQKADAAMLTQREAADRAAGEHIEKLTALGGNVASVLADSQKDLARQIAAFNDMAASHHNVAKMQQKLSDNLELVTTADAFKQTLKGIDRGLNRLHPVLSELGDRAGVIFPDDDGGRRRGFGRFFRRNRKGS